MLQNFYTTSVQVLLAKNNVEDKNWRGAGLGSIQKIWDPLRISATVEASNFKFGFGTSLPKKNVQDQNWQVSGPGENQKKLGPPYLFLQPLKLATEKLVQNVSSGLFC